eukprot:5933084-Karenia_brevis.AAC.1
MLVSVQNRRAKAAPCLVVSLGIIGSPLPSQVRKSMHQGSQSLGSEGRDLRTLPCQLWMKPMNSAHEADPHRLDHKGTGVMARFEDTIHSAEDPSRSRVIAVFCDGDARP